jgi:hypothetical protein
MDFSQFNVELTDFRSRLHEETKSNSHDSGKTIRTVALNEIRKNIATLTAHFNTINAKNILTFENDLENKDGIQAEINNLAQAITTYEATHKENERVLVGEANQLQIKFASLLTRLQYYQNPTGEYALKLDTCREAINNEKADDVLPPLSNFVDVSKFHIVRQAEADYKDLRSHEFELIRAENSLQTALNINRQIIENLCESSALTMMLELKESRKLSASMQARSFAATTVLESFNSQYSGIYALISADEEKLKKHWIEAENAIQFVMEDTERDIHSLQETINTRTREEELHAISHNIDHQSGEIARLARAIQNLRISFSQTSAIYETKKRELVDGVRLQLNEIRANAKSVLHKEKQALMCGMDLQLDNVVNYRADSTVSAIDKIKLMDANVVATLNADIANLRLSFMAKTSLLNKAQAKRDHQVRKRELAEIERYTRDHCEHHHQHVGKSEQNIQENSGKKPGFFRRHWKLITAATTTFALCGAGTGAAIALFSSVPTLGLGMIAIPVFAAAGLVLGAAVGFLSGVFGCAVKDCCYPANKEGRTINHKSSTLNYGATGNIQSALGMKRRSGQTFALNSETVDLRELDANLPPLTVIQQERVDTRPGFKPVTPHTARWQPLQEDMDLPRLSVVREKEVPVKPNMY